jgi:arabinan endo-1,5-alpha-L-arabinosidase
MRWRYTTLFLRGSGKIFCALIFFISISAFALDGAIGIHDPSTVVKCAGNYYVFGTGRGLPFLVSSNGFDWRRGGRVFTRIPDSVKEFVPLNNGTDIWAPDIILLNGKFYLYYAVSKWNSFVSAVGLLTNPTLDTNNPDYKWTDGGMIVHSSEGENLNAIDPGVTLAPDGKLWLSYGSYHGNIELVELDPQTGRRIGTNSPVRIIANESEASDIIFHNGYFYLFVNHGGCCQGSNSTYNIRVGRAQKITGPYLDRFGENLVGGGGWLFLAAQGKDIGPGHFGLLADEGVEKFSCHYEAELGRNRSLLDIRPLLWTPDGWPLAGENVRDGIYQIRSRRTGMILQADDNGVETAHYLLQENQKWKITPAGHGFYKISSAPGKKVLQTTGENVEVARFTGAENQLWKIDEISENNYRIASQANNLALTALNNENPENGLALKTFTGDDAQQWVITAP